MPTVTLGYDTCLLEIAPLTMALDAAKVSIERKKEASFAIKVGEKTYSKSGADLSALLRYAGKVGEMYPSDPEAALLVDHVLDLIAAPEPDLNAINAEYVTATATAKVKGSLLGNQITVADVALVGLLGFEQFKALHNASMAAMAHAGVELVKSRPVQHRVF